MRAFSNSSVTHLQHQCLRILLRQLHHDRVHPVARFGPWGPKINQRHSGEVSGEERLEMVGRFDNVDGRHEWTNESPATTMSTNCRDYQAPISNHKLPDNEAQLRLILTL